MILVLYISILLNIVLCMAVAHNRSEADELGSNLLMHKFVQNKKANEASMVAQWVVNCSSCTKTIWHGTTKIELAVIETFGNHQLLVMIDGVASQTESDYLGEDMPIPKFIKMHLPGTPDILQSAQIAESILVETLTFLTNVIRESK